MAAAVTLGVVTAEVGLRTSSGVTTTTVLLEPHIVRGVLFSLKPHANRWSQGYFSILKLSFLSLFPCSFFVGLVFFTPISCYPPMRVLSWLRNPVKTKILWWVFFYLALYLAALGGGGGSCGFVLIGFFLLSFSDGEGLS